VLDGSLKEEREGVDELITIFALKKKGTFVHNSPSATGDVSCIPIFRE
jgi:hypothetical protein